MRKVSFFKKGDIFIYLILFFIFLFLGKNILKKNKIENKKVEIYVNSKLVYVHKLITDEKILFIDTEIGGINIQFKDKKVRVLTSNSPKKIAVKQGWIKNSGEIILGIPDKLVIKIIGEGEEELDYVAK
jgi:hypothetical protein